MATDGKFSTATVETLSKRAALLCSNPDCGALTSGPTSESIGAVNLGEAAHIYGRTSTSARYTADLTAAELCDITNGIWLCRNCHKVIDNDPPRFPAELLFQWRRRHEQSVLERLGKPGERLRETLKAEHLRLFAETSYLAQQIVLDRPEHWEYKLTMEILRSGLGEVYERWRHLKHGMYVRKSTVLPANQVAEWLSAKINDASKIIGAVRPLLDEMKAAWGPPGVSGDDRKILTVCKLIVAAGENLLVWEEDVRFVHVPEAFRDVLSSIQGVAGHQLDQLLKIPNELSSVFSMDKPTGEHKINLVFDVPNDFVTNFGRALQRATKAFQHR
jgi:hypothetical protein